ncbi:hypothetical protein [Allorhizobium undicola]|uniref:hypothetical protein n=1 Tax=Allorhizobium undicola TaxID=78527 RepID=UPI000486F3BE|nr:hypothetical protein [Allorhizobium undicola]
MNDERLEDAKYVGAYIESMELALRVILASLPAKNRAYTLSRLNDFYENHQLLVEDNATDERMTRRDAAFDLWEALAETAEEEQSIMRSYNQPQD